MIDIRSDTVTLPTPAMYQAMATVKLGDDVYDDDPTTQALQDKVCELLGFEAALFVPSGTQSNLTALLSHCQRGDEYITGNRYHIYRYEAGGAAVLGSIQPQPIAVEYDGSLDLANVEQSIKEDDFHFAKTKLLCLENTHYGLAISLEKMQQAVKFCQTHQLKLHLDGARLFNAAIKLNVSAKTLVDGFDSVSVCLSKGLGAPVGSVLCGSPTLIHSAKRWRKMLGGGMRQTGVIAACGLVALDNLERLAEDHQKASELADKLAQIDGVSVIHQPMQTNMVFIEVKTSRSGVELEQFMAKRGIKMSYDKSPMRLVLHQDIQLADVDTIAQAFEQLCRV